MIDGSFAVFVQLHSSPTFSKMRGTFFTITLTTQCELYELRPDGRTMQLDPYKSTPFENTSAFSNVTPYSTTGSLLISYVDKLISWITIVSRVLPPKIRRTPHHQL